MTDRFYAFSVGSFRCTSVADGGLDYRPDHMFNNVTPDELTVVLKERGLPITHVNTPYTCLFVDTGQHKVLVDNGVGSNLPTSPGTLRENLRAAGIKPEEVDTVIVTHAHPDHIGGTTLEDGSLAYPNARYFVARQEWEFWFSDAPQAVEFHITLARKGLEPVQERVTLFDPGEVILPGITSLPAAGHTPGHTALEIESDGERLLHVSDTVLHPLHLEFPHWLPVFDLDRVAAEDSKQRIFARASQTRSLVFAHHFPPFPNLGHVDQAGEGWRWEPVAKSF